MRATRWRTGAGRTRANGFDWIKPLAKMLEGRKAWCELKCRQWWCQSREEEEGIESGTGGWRLPGGRSFCVAAWTNCVVGPDARMPPTGDAVVRVCPYVFHVVVLFVIVVAVAAVAPLWLCSMCCAQILGVYQFLFIAICHSGVDFDI